jgi:hypothetical protein
MTRQAPLQWPDGWPRSKSRSPARFDMSLDRAERDLRWQIEQLGGTYPLITHDRFARNGMDPTDPGVAVYFSVEGQQRVFAADRWDRIRDNIRAIAKTIEALRGIERWGASEMMERAFAAFVALPAPSWRDELGYEPGARPKPAEVEARYRELAKRWHPDAAGGNAEKFKAITAARDAARKELS